MTELDKGARHENFADLHSCAAFFYDVNELRLAAISFFQAKLSRLIIDIKGGGTCRRFAAIWLRTGSAAIQLEQVQHNLPVPQMVPRTVVAVRVH
jgi:hypothetical protein